ncbi:MAG: ABC transporter ATP-binding protein [Phycisphaerales bacterium]|nr:ABC transporter ATP-binding protein [Phycisphaerales bacterium]
MVQAAIGTTRSQSSQALEAKPQRLVAPPAIEVSGVSKCYQIYRKPSDRLKQAMVRWKKKYYREFWALRDCSFILRQGETLGIIGRNGSGKSTLAQMIAGTLSPTEGAIRVHGKISALLELGAGFNQEFTGRENVYLAGSVRGFSRKQVGDLFERIVEFADIGDFIDQPVKTYSSGMYIRLAFAVAAQVRPEILIVDEALAVGDVFFQQRCHQFMREELAGTTKLMVTHDLNAVANHCDRAIVLHHGRMVFEGKPLDAISYYTRISHTEQFGGGTASSQGDLRSANSSGIPEGETIPWLDVGEEHRGGAGEVLIERVAIVDPNGESVRTIQPGDSFSCHFQVVTPVPKADLIFGVTIYDRFGKAICGDNSLSLSDGRIAFPEPGRYVVRLDYTWPELQPGEYSATFGVGEGLHPLHHTVQCWAHNLVAITAISPRRAVHGLFTNPVKDMRVHRVG